MKKYNQLFSVVLLISICFSYSIGDTTQENIVSGLQSVENTINECITKTYTHNNMKAEVITWRNESAVTILAKDRIVFREAFFSHSGFNGSFIEDGSWSPDGKYFAFRLLSSGGHMPYRTPVKIFYMDGNSSSILDTESIIAKIPNISNITVGSYSEPYMRWLSDTQLQVSVVSHDKESDSGMYVINLYTLTAKKYINSIPDLPKSTDNLSAPRGSSKRKLILDALRQKIREEHNLDVVFIVRYLKSNDEWAWVHVFPQSKDSRNHYEDIFALLNKSNNTWRVIEIPCAEEEDPECITSPGYFSSLQKRFPNMPEEILP